MENDSTFGRKLSCARVRNAPGHWFYGDHYQSLGLVETESHLPGAARELSMYFTENTANTTDVGYVRRYTIRMDRFVSVTAPARGGELLTKPIRFDGNRLIINFSTSVAGGVRVELQQADGTPLPGYALSDSVLAFGDQVDRVVTWNNGAAVGKLAGQTVRLRFELKDADLYSFRFQGP